MLLYKNIINQLVLSVHKLSPNNEELAQNHKIGPFLPLKTPKKTWPFGAMCDI